MSNPDSWPGWVWILIVLMALGACTSAASSDAGGETNAECVQRMTAVALDTVPLLSDGIALTGWQANAVQHYCDTH